MTFAMATLNSDDLEVLGERIRDELRNQVGDAHSSKRLRKVFRTFDTNNDGHITLKEFQKGLKRLLGAPFDHLKDEELQELIRRFDRREDGMMHFYRSFGETPRKHQHPQQVRSTMLTLLPL